MPDRVWKTGNTKSTENTEGKRGRETGNREVQGEFRNWNSIIHNKKTPTLQSLKIQATAN
jgi:hypothetical protein